ncbi:MAG: OB-fold domain-containing protein, partial [Actinomycetota bacterium]|nr:OB-fold domain-containing protein [Actinomycetota bacterium]
FLQWREMLPVQPPNRPAPSRISASASKRESDWKHGFIASRGDQSGLIHMPPSRLSIDETDNDDAMLMQSMAASIGTVATFTVDHLVYSQNPPVVFAVVDFDNGGRIPIEVTDVADNEVEIGMNVEPTFRKLFTADGLHNYFWKVRPIRSLKE